MIPDNCRFEHQKQKETIEQFDRDYSNVIGTSEIGIPYFLKTSSQINKNHIPETGNMVSPSFDVYIPMLTVSEANGLLSKERFYKNGKAKPEHWTESSRRHKEQKKAVYLHLNPLRSKFSLPCTVTLTRFAPRELDEDDNLRIAVKWVKDAIAEVITQDFVPGRADGNKSIKWKYHQEKSKDYGVRITFEF